MEFYQSCQNRANQTIAVVNQHLPGLVVSGISTAAMTSLCQNLDGLAQTRDTKVTDEDAARNTERIAFLLLRRLTINLPAAAAAELDDDILKERDLENLLDPVYAITPRTTELAIQRGRALVAVLTRIDAYLNGLPVPRPAVTAAGKGLANLTAAITALDPLEQDIETKAAGSTEARTDLHNGARALDRINKRFYKRLVAEARENPNLAAALHQIETESANMPETLSMQTLIQSGPESLHIAVSYVAGSGSNATERTVEWEIEGEQTDFANSMAADFSGNLLGPFTPGQVIRVRTRTVNSNGTRTSAVRKLVILAP